MTGTGKEHQIKKDMRTALLLVTTGTTREESGKLINNYIAVLKREFPDTVIRYAFMSEHVRQALALDGEIERSPLGAMADLIDEGFTKIIVQPLYFKPGNCLHLLYPLVSTLNGMTGKHGTLGIEGILMGSPLLSDMNSYELTSEAIVSYLGTPGETEAFVLVSTAEEPGEDSSLCQLQLVLDERAGGSIIIGSSHGYPDRKWVMKRLEHINVRKVVLVPFVLISGNHSVYELEGENEASWKKVLENGGYEVTISGKVFADSKEISRLLVSSLREIGESHGFL